MKKVAALIAFGGLMWAGSGLVQGAEQTWVGTISDSLCGASHEAMRQNGKQVSDRECVMACTSYQTEDAPKYVVVSGGKVYPIANQTFAGLARQAGQNVEVTGDLTDGTITVSRIRRAKTKS